MVKVFSRIIYALERRVIGYKLFRRSSARLRLLWCCLFVFTRPKVKVLVFLVATGILARHLYQVSIFQADPYPSAGPVKECGFTLSRRSMDRFKAWKTACGTGKLRATDEDKVRNYYYGDKKNKFMFCSVPQVSDTFWKSVIRYVDNTSKTIHGTYDNIPRWQTYYLQKKYIWETPESTIRFLFGQDPYVRLWHVWIEKFFLTGYWFKDFGIYQDISEQNADKTPKCAPDVTFVDFLSMIAKPKKVEHPAELNINWRPQVYICDVCALRPHYVGHQETFEEDAQCLLQVSNLSWILSHEPETFKMGTAKIRISPMNQKQTYARDIRNLVMENFARWHTSKAMQECITLPKLVEKLWKAFQYKGYTPPNMNIPQRFLTQKEEIHVKDFIQECTQSFYFWPGSNIRVRAQRRVVEARKFITRAYEVVPTPTLEMLETLYSSDFASLGYNSRPDDIFAHRYDAVQVS